jgi:hypothetical protein
MYNITLTRIIFYTVYVSNHYLVLKRKIITLHTYNNIYGSNIRMLNETSIVNLVFYTFHYYISHTCIKQCETLKTS